ncbi:MAG: HAMP domain-containing protein [Anaerolineales bacterium]|nr:HAMP domain-containing protein [Anaerolineales bacterium]
MKSLYSLNTRLVLSHLAVSLISIILMASFAGRFIFRAALAETEHNLQGLAVAAGNALVLPIQEMNQGTGSQEHIRDLLLQLFADNPDMGFTVYTNDGRPIADNNTTLPPPATRTNAPEVIEALESGLGRGVDIRRNVGGDEKMYTAVVIQREIEVLGVLRLEVPLRPTQEAARRSFYVLLATALAITSGVGLFGWLLANNLARPIQVLTQASEDMAKGDLSVRVRPSGPQELRRLAEAFNSMASRQQTNVSELRAFVANASHELRTPLTVVKLRAEALREGALQDPEVAERFMSEIDTEVDRLVRMVNDLLDLSRMEAGMVANQRTTVNLTAIAHEVYETFSIRASKASVNLSLDVAPEISTTLGNEDQLRQVFYNLVENAIKYTPAGGQVEMLLRPGPKENTVRFLVRDTGPGIPPEHLAHVFERFYRVEAIQSRPGSSRGSGLGLAIAKSIVDSHGGEIGASSQVGNGSTFWADLPASG